MLSTADVVFVVQETTAHEVVMLALQEFGMTETGSNYFSLCEVSVAEGGIIKQKRLPDQLQNLAERIGLSSRCVASFHDTARVLQPGSRGTCVGKITEGQGH